MKGYKIDVGKITLTTEGRWDVNNHYDRLCLVHDGNFASYLSRKEVPAGTLLEDEEFWQPVANLQTLVRLNYERFKEQTVEDMNQFKEELVDSETAFKTSVQDVLVTMRTLYNEHDEWIKHLVPEVDWEQMNDHFDEYITKMYDEGRVKFGIKSYNTIEDRDAETNPEKQSFVYVVETNKYYTYSSKDNVWHDTPEIYIGSQEPSDDVLWIDPSGTDLNAKEINVIQAELKALQEKIDILQNMRIMGLIPGDATVSYRTLVLAGDTEVEAPDILTESTDNGEVETEKPVTTVENFTTTAVACKIDTADNFNRYKQNLIDGELIFITDKPAFAIYYGGSFHSAESPGTDAITGSTISGGGQGISVETFETTNFQKMNFVRDDNKIYQIYPNADGEFTFRQIDYLVNKNYYKLDGNNGVYANYRLLINAIYCGSESKDSAATHNYVELSNSSEEDINLNSFYLAYTENVKSGDNVGFDWKILKLKGIIKAGGTFVIRGAQVNIPKRALINVNSYDMEWLDTDGNPITFAQDKITFMLFVGDYLKTHLDNKIISYFTVPSAGIADDFIMGSALPGYVDGVGIGSSALAEGNSSISIDSTVDRNKIFFIRWFSLEKATQGLKAYSDRKSSALWTYIDVSKQTTKKGNSIQYYYPDYMKIKNTPKASYDNKDFFTNKTIFKEDKPNYINNTFGIQATDAGSGATRCFAWISVGYYEEFIEYRVKGTSTWNKVYSFIADDSSNPSWVNDNIDFYKRVQWNSASNQKVTSHKVIIKNLVADTYEYRVGRDNNDFYYSNIYEFTIKKNSDVTSFDYIQITDQQGFNWQEYTAWTKTAKAIKDNELDYDFLINTGDITQSGNRCNEWLDYYEGKELLIDKAEMFTIGNNDLCADDPTYLGLGSAKTSKYNPINLFYYYCFEVDTNNQYNYITYKGKRIPIYSLYSFNYGAFHFVSIVSEYSDETSKVYFNGDTDSNFTATINANIEDWFKRDLQIWKDNDEEPSDCGKCIVYMHEMPFTIVTDAFMTGTSGRSGSHLNTINANGAYRFSRIFKQYGIKLVMGGHKHTYCITKPIYDAPDDYITNNTVNSSSTLLPTQGGISDETSRRPVIQVTNSNDIENNNYARYEVVSKITAPTYVMSQASAYKLVSNKELPASSSTIIPWLLAYYPHAGTTANASANKNQRKPMYIRYNVTDTAITVTAKQVENVWDHSSGSPVFDMNNQPDNISVTPMTLSTTTEKNKSSYGAKNNDSYIINI